MILEGRAEVFGKPCPSATLPTTVPTRTSLESNRDRTLTVSATLRASLLLWARKVNSGPYSRTFWCTRSKPASPSAFRSMVTCLTSFRKGWDTAKKCENPQQWRNIIVRPTRTIWLEVRQVPQSESKYLKLSHGRSLSWSFPVYHLQSWPTALALPSAL